MDVVEGGSHLLCGEPQQVCGADSAAEQSRAQVGVLGILQVEDQLPELALVPSAACARQRLLELRRQQREARAGGLSGTSKPGDQGVEKPGLRASPRLGR